MLLDLVEGYRHLGRIPGIGTGISLAHSVASRLQ